MEKNDEIAPQKPPPPLPPSSSSSVTNKIENNNSISVDKPSKTSSLIRSSSSSSSELSPLSSPGHRSPPPETRSPPPDSPLSSPSPPQNRRSPPPDSSTSSDLSHPSPSRNGPPVKEKSPATSHVAPRNGLGGGGRKVRQPVLSLRRERREKTARRAGLGFRVGGFVFCLISLAVMAADKKRGWAVDSFYRYKEFRYCLSVNVVGFLYSAIQICDLTFTMCTGKNVLQHQYRYYFDFAMDQILTYLLMSASSSAATRVDDWESNWGKDKFPMMASVSVGLSFMSFVSLAASTLVSGYTLCTWSSS